MQHSESPTLQRTDASYSLPFLSASAAALHDQGLFSDLEADHLRLELKERHRHLRAGEASLWLELLADRSPLVRLLEALLGANAVSRLFLRWTVARVLEDFLPSLQSLASSLLKKAELMFNQSFFIYQGSHCERRTLFSFFLVDLGEELLASYQSYEAIMKELRTVEGSAPLGGSSCFSFEHRLAQHLGFHEKGEGTRGELRLEGLLYRLQLELRLLGERLEACTRQFPHNLEAPRLFEQLALTFEAWRAQLSLMTALPLGQDASLERMEHRRLRFMSALLEFRKLLDAQKSLLHEILKTSHIRSQERDLWPEAEQRELLGRLLGRGMSLQEAEPALASLVTYCRQHHVKPDQLLEAELHRIHPQLDAPCLMALKQLSLSQGDNPEWIREKQTVLTRKDHLLQKLALGASPLALIMLGLTMWFGGCGVKTAPRSDVLDLRPAVPYHAEQRASPKARDLPAQAPKSTHEE